MKQHISAAADDYTSSVTWIRVYTYMHLILSSVPSTDWYLLQKIDYMNTFDGSNALLMLFRLKRHWPQRTLLHKQAGLIKYNSRDCETVSEESMSSHGHLKFRQTGSVLLLKKTLVMKKSLIEWLG